VSASTANFLIDISPMPTSIQAQPQGARKVVFPFCRVSRRIRLTAFPSREVICPSR
jgi:hypothetical protein